jgi:tetratricopeptide (TPR) repeat protein
VKRETSNCKLQTSEKQQTPSSTRGLTIWSVCLLAAFWSLRAGAESTAAAFEEGNKLYYEGKFAEAAGAYEKLVRSGQTSPALYFNLGNACFKSGQIGRAIVAYRQAERMTPRDPDVRANLQFAHNQTQGPTLSPNRWQRWLGKLTLNEWTLLAAGAVWLWLLLLALLQWRPGWGKPLRAYVAALSAAAVLSCSSLAAAYYGEVSTRTAIVTVHDAVARYGPLEGSQNAFTVHDGAELRLLDQKQEWLQVSAGPGRIGWLRRSDVVVPPRS